MSQPTVSIIGAGISGLILARCLSRRGIRAVLYEKDSQRQATTRHGYGISLHRSACRPLLDVLNIDETSLKRKVAVDAAVGGVGRLSEQDDESSFRANRRKFEQMLQEGLQIKWEYSLDNVTSKATADDAIQLIFSSGEQVSSDIVIATDGPHSQVRKHVSPSSKFEFLPYAVYNGKRRIDRTTFDKDYAPRIHGANLIEHNAGEALLQISINDYSDDHVSISHTYSRPARESDPLLRADRPKSGAKSIPDELFEEISSLNGLPSPFKEIFDADAMRSDRLLHWLMRSVLVPRADLTAAADQGVVFVGDAAHHGPILGSQGANEAIQDAMALADHIADTGSGKLADFYVARYGRWTQYVEEGKAQLAATHGQKARSQL